MPAERAESGRARSRRVVCSVSGILMRLSVVGCGEAFGSGGRLQTAYHLSSGGAQDNPEEVLIDCGATTLVGLQRLSIDPNRIGAVLISHLHGDHFGGLPWLLLHARHAARRTAPLVIAGPAGTRERVRAASEALFPESMRTEPSYPLSFIDWEPSRPVDIGSYRVTPFEVSHPSGAMPFALRVTAGGRTLAFSGDTEWTDNLLQAADGADVFIVECQGWDQPPRYHMSWSVLQPRLGAIRARHIMLTHMGAEMLAQAPGIAGGRVLLAADGLVMDV